jgi:hypothetical protein
VRRRAGRTLTEQHKATAGKLIDAALADAEGYRRLAYLCYRIGPRLSWPAGLERASAWSGEQIKAAGLNNVCVIPVKVLKWARDALLHILGLGMSVATPPGGITAKMDFNNPGAGYGASVAERSSGPSRAAALGAVGVLVRVTPLAMQIPRTAAR